jgi:hypothetical protein
MMKNNTVKEVRPQIRNDDANQKEEVDRAILRKKNCPS